MPSFLNIFKDVEKFLVTGLKDTLQVSEVIAPFALPILNLELGPEAGVIGAAVMNWVIVAEKALPGDGLGLTLRKPFVMKQWSDTLAFSNALQQLLGGKVLEMSEEQVSATVDGVVAEFNGISQIMTQLQKVKNAPVSIPQAAVNGK